MAEERREYQRLALTKPIDGKFGEYDIRLLDVSATGARVESHDHIPPHARAKLRFSWRDHDIELMAETARTGDDVAGLRFLEDSEMLRMCLAQSALEVLRAQEANLEGERERNVIAGDETLTAASAGLKAKGFITWTLGEAGWKRRRSLLPDQPDDGITVSASEPQEQVDLLLHTYETGNEEARMLTRLLAELSVATVR